MNGILGKLDKSIESISKTVDNSIESDQERRESLLESQRIDLTSPFKLPHLIRPIAFIWAMSLQTISSIIVLVLAFKSDPIDSSTIMVVVSSNTAILTTIVGFYFASRKNEKISFNRNAAALALEEMKNKAEFKREEFRLKHKKNRD